MVSHGQKEPLHCVGTPPGESGCKNVTTAVTTGPDRRCDCRRSEATYSSRRFGQETASAGQHVASKLRNANEAALQLLGNLLHD